MRIPIAVCSIALVFAGVAMAQSRRDEIKKITTDFENAQQAFFKKYGEAKTDDERNQLYQKENPDPATWAPKIWAIIDADPKDEAALEGLTWIGTHVSGQDRTKAIDLLSKNHIKSEGVGDVCTQLYQPSPENEAFMRKVLEENPNATAQGKACYALAKLLVQAKEAKEELGGERGKSLEQYYGKPTVEWLKGLDSGDVQSDVEELFERCASDFADVEYMKGYKTVGQLAKGDLFELQNLVIGKTAPEITGKDQDGTEFKLSDYRGKVVVIDFWGYW
jgi:hypothetical protein